MLLIVIELLNLEIELVLLKLELLGLVCQDLLLDLGLEAVHGLLEKNEQSTCAVKLVDELVAFFEELG